MNERLYIVGGAVRDFLLGRPVVDLDLVCRYARKAAQQAAKECNGSLVVLDDQNKIYRVVLREPHPYKTLDFAEMQGASIEKDLARRDFTVNAMAMRISEVGFRISDLKIRNPQSEIRNILIDPFQGQKDLKNKILRGVSAGAFKDDPLRVLRAFRFMAQLGFKVEAQTLGWIKRSKALLDKVAAERIRHELLVLFEQPKVSDTLRAMDSMGLLTQIFPDLEAGRRTAIRYYGKGGVLKHALATVEAFEHLVRGVGDVRDVRDVKSPAPNGPNLPNVPDLSRYLASSVSAHPRVGMLKIAALLHDVGKPATAKVIKGRLRFFEHEHVGAEQAYRGLAALRFSRQECLLARGWVKNHMRLGSLAAIGEVSNKAIARFFRDLGEDGIGMVLLSLADHFTYLKRSLWGKNKDSVEKMARRMLKAYGEEREKILPKRLLNGFDLMKALKIKPGPIVGELLEKIQEAQVMGKVATTEEALEFVKRQKRLNKD